MKNTMTIVFVSCIVVSSFFLRAEISAQTWSKKFDLPFSVIDGDLSRTTDGGSIGVAYNTLGFSIVKFDSSGNEVFRKEYTDSSSSPVFTSIREAFNGIVFAGYDSSEAYIFVVRTDTSGNIVWQKRYKPGPDPVWSMPPDRPSRPHASIIDTKEGSADAYVLAANIRVVRPGHYVPDQPVYRDEIWVLKLDQNGNVLWEKMLGGYTENTAAQGNVGAYAVNRTDSVNLPHSFVIAGEAAAFGPTCATDLWVFQMDGSGSVNWQKKFRGAALYPNCIPDGRASGAYAIENTINQSGQKGLIVAGYTGTYSTPTEYLVATLDASGTALATRRFGISSFRDEARYIFQTTDGYILTGNASNYGAWVLKLLPDISIVHWQKLYYQNEFNLGYKIMLDPSGGYLLAGGDGHFLRFLVIDSNGGLDLACTQPGVPPNTNNPVGDGIWQDTSAEIYTTSEEISVPIFASLGCSTTGLLETCGTPSGGSLPSTFCPQVDLQGFHAGRMAAPGTMVPESEEQNPLKLVLEENDDKDDGLGQPDYNDTMIGANDNDIVKLTLKHIDGAVDGVVDISFSSQNVHVFKPSGSALLADYQVDLANPQGDLAGLASGDVSIFVEALDVSGEIIVTMNYRDPNLQLLGSDQVRMASVSLRIEDDLTPNPLEDPKQTILVAGLNPADSVQLRVNVGIPVAGIPVDFSIDSGNGTISPLNANTNSSGIAVSTLTAPTATSVTKVKATVSDSTALDDAIVYIYKGVYTPTGAIYNFHKLVITNTAFTLSPTNLDSESEVQDYLNSRPGNRCLMNPYGQVGQFDKRVFVASALDAPVSGTILIDNEQIPYARIYRYPANTTGWMYGAMFDTPARAPGSAHAINSNVYVMTLLSSDIGPSATTIPVQSVLGALNQGSLRFNPPTGDTCQYNGIQQSPPAFLNCVRGPGAPHSYPTGTPVFFSKTTVGVIPARLIVENSLLWPISTPAILTMMQREQSLIDADQPCVASKYDEALGVKNVNKNLVTQLYEGTFTMYNAYLQTPSEPFYFDGVGWPKRTYYENSSQSLKDVKLKADNAGTYSLFRFNQFVKNLPDGGGNLLYFRMWLQLGF
jgi:hypothetical protein